MKKCPKCGTILDDSKKKCYMCGADLQKSPVDFSASFDSQIGATVTTSQDNVFNNVDNISVKVSEVINSSNKTATFSQDVSSSSFFKNELDSLNSMQYDERTAIEKIFSNDNRFRSKDEINANEAMRLNDKKMSDSSNLFMSDNRGFDNTLFNKEVEPNNLQTRQSISEQRPAINWGNNLQNNNNDVSKYKDKVSRKLNINHSLVFNISCFVIFIGLVIFGYFKFVRQPKDDSISLGGLKYSIDSDFILRNNDAYSKYYTYGENCAININYEQVSNDDGFVANYFESKKAEFEKNSYTSKVEKIKINDNVWSSLSFMDLQDNPAASSGFSSITKYRYVSIIYKGNFYNIIYVNTQNDSECSVMYEKLIETLSFS